MELQHPELGTIRGVQTGPDIIQYRGLPYGVLEKRFTKAKLATSLTNDGTGIFDATNFGPQSPQPPKMMEHELEVFGASLNCPPDREPPMDEFRCLNLVVTAPAALTKNLPVLFWIHGGNLVSGSNWYPLGDPTNLVAHSVKIGKPIITVNINYRMGFFALLKSVELKESVSTNGNLCFHDQKLALEWVNKYISGFGGSPSKVTCAGESAGSGSTQVLLMGEEPLFQQAMLMSGSAPLMGTVPDVAHEEMYQNLLKAFDLSDSPKEERLRRLQGEMTVDEILSKIPPYTPFKMGVDGEFIKKDLNWDMFTSPGSTIASPKWCSRLMAGELADDSSILTFLTYSHWPDPGASIHAAFNHFLGEKESTKLLSLYGLHPPAPKDVAVWGIHDLINDLAFTMPMYKIAQRWPSRDNSYFYRINEPVRWPGHIFNGRVPHIWDVALLFGNLSDQLSEQQNAVGKDLQCRVIQFVNGAAPWSNLGDGKAYNFGSDAASGERDVDEGGRRFECWKVIEEIGHDHVWMALGAGFLASGPAGFQK